MCAASPQLHPPPFALQGRTYEPDGVKDEMADAIREFNRVVVSDPRVDVISLPFRDGVNIVMRKYASTLAYSRQSC